MNLIEIRKNMNFKKVNQHTYQIDVPNEIINYVDDVMKTLAGDMLAHSQVLDQPLKEQLIARAIATCFMTVDRIKTLDHGFTIINVKAGDRSFKMSAGIWNPSPTECEILSGVIYKE